MQLESRAVTLPLAAAAPSGKLAPHLGPSFARCAVLESFRLGGASVDLLVVTGNGDVALGECKRGSSLRKVRFSQVLKELGVRSEKKRRRWFRRVEHCCSDGEIHLFAAVGRAGERAVDIWVIEKSGEVRT